MKDKIIYKNWDTFKVKGNIGVVTTYFTELFLTKSFNIHNVNYENYELDMELNGIETVFMDNEIYESDHPWYHKHRGEYIKYLKTNNITLIVIQNTTSRISNMFNNSYAISINSDRREYFINEGNILEIPLLLDEKIINPINSRSKRDITYLNIATGSVSRSHNLNFSFTKSNVTSVKLSKSLIQNLIEKIREYKILYVSSTTKIDLITLKYIQTIAEISATRVIYDHKFIDLNMPIEFNSIAVNDNLIFMTLRNPHHALRISIVKQRHALLHHTFIFNQTLIEFLKNNKNDRIAKISIITPTNRKHNLSQYFEELNKQEKVKLDVVLVTHGFELSQDEITLIKKEFKHELTVLYRETETSLGNCLNAAIEITKYDVIAKIDDDDYYYKHYLLDQWLAIQYTDADVIGKSGSFYYFEIDDLYVIRRPDEYHKYCKHIMGATIMSPSKVMKELLFSDLPKAVDSDYLHRLRENKGRIYATHPYEMCVFRSYDKKNHTWQIEDKSLFRHATVVGYGNPKTFVETNI